MNTALTILAKKGPFFNTVSPDTKVIEALSLMKSENLSYVIVMQQNDFMGIMSERDYAQKVVLLNKNSSDTTVQEIMTVGLPIISMDTTSDECMKLMNQHKTRYLVAFEEIDFRGIITIHDLVRDTLAAGELPPKEPIY
jgi:predicted transcriptional regulator